MESNIDNINNNNLKVNAEITFDEYLESLKVEADFEDDIKAIIKKDEAKADKKKAEFLSDIARQEKFPEFFERIPECQLAHVHWKIKRQFNGDTESYIKTRNLFQLFTKKHKLICDEQIKMGDDERKKKNKLRKDYLLWSSQLLGLVGFGGAKYINESLLNIYKKEQQEQDDFLLSYRLINSKGNIVKLTDLETKKRIQIARILRTSDALSKIAIDRGFEYSLITITLPPVFHGNAVQGSSEKYQGWLPSKAHAQLEKFWQEIRANWAKKGFRASTDYFGCSVFESHQSSVPHKHILVYYSHKNKKKFDEVVKDVEARARVAFHCPKFKIDISDYDPKKGTSGAGYIFKYITKTCGMIDGADDATIKNMAVRWYYSARAFNFFGVKKATTKFNYLCENWKTYEDAFSDEIKEMFSTYDYYSFINTYEKYFDVVRDGDSKIKFVTFDFAGNLKEPQKIDLLRNKLIIEKKIFTVFDVNTATQGVDSIDALVRNLDTEHAFSAWELAQELEEGYKSEIAVFISNEKSACFRVGDNLDKIMSSYLDDLSKKIYSFFNDVVTVNQSFSSENHGNELPMQKTSEKYIYSPRLSDVVNEKIRKLVEKRRKEQGLK
ncbi:replication endonuclease [Burkholderia cenocepacia]|uniref:replication endonuclease n=1 Tax=Burkholderia cenocepacia TaxID=95486 RepID=UPI001B9F5E20|nr:replication endonuclease [Burkholderia cenocepacia]MBR8426605.1 replication endonuclease [Burkholderia cenocepacia]